MATKKVPLMRVTSVRMKPHILKDLAKLAGSNKTGLHTYMREVLEDHVKTMNRARATL